MRPGSIGRGAAIILLPLAAICQEPRQQQTQAKSGVPLYDVTVIERTTPAINYAYRGGPTKIDFRGTVLLPDSKGEATVESLRGRTQIDAKFENLLPSQRFGREYLTYCLWALTPEGVSRNLGELVPDSSNKAKVHVTTDLDTFGLIVAAEPYAAADQPSNVVVLENQVRPETIGKIEQISAKYELLPRGHYTWEGPTNGTGDEAQPKVSMSRYEATLQLYEAQNAVAIAGAAGADRYAHDTIAKAEALLEQAQRNQADKGPAKAIVETAREAAQTAEDALLLTQRRQKDEKLHAAQREAAQAKDAEAQAQAAAARAQAEAEAARIREQIDREARVRAEADAAAARARLAQQSTVAATAPAPARLTAPPDIDGQKTDSRARLFQELNSTMNTLDTPRGLTVTIAGSEFIGPGLAGEASAQMGRLVASLSRYPDLRVEVDGYSDTADSEAQSESRADMVRHLLLERGMAANRVTVRACGNARPIASNATAEGRAANRRVEIVIAGNSIGARPVWDHGYTLAPGM